MTKSRPRTYGNSPAASDVHRFRATCAVIAPKLSHPGCHHGRVPGITRHAEDARWNTSGQAKRLPMTTSVACCPLSAWVDCPQLTRTHLINGERVRCWRFGAGARREEGAYPCWICDRRATRPAPKICNPPGEVLAGCWPRCSSVTERAAMLLRCALPATRQSFAHPFSIYEMGSKLSKP